MARTKARVNMDSPPVAYVKIMGPGSGADRNMKERANAVARRAVVLAPKVSNHLAGSIKASQTRDERGRFSFGYEVVANARYAAYVHEGTRVDVRDVYPGFMKFDGTNIFKGHTIYTERVVHPGTRAQPFLTEALTAAV